jgi:2-oxo-3-hexenedioate decarboxylase
LEPEAVFGMKDTPPANASLDALFDALEWVAPGFEVVQSHLQDWRFKAADTVADGGLHARLLVGRKVPVGAIAANVAQLNAVLGAARVNLINGEQILESGCGANVLGGPLLALQHFLKELRACPGAPDLRPGDVITTGTWTDAWPVLPGEQWTGEFGAPLSDLKVTFE